ncbi:MAG: hypothetical protein HY046_13025 [Acidobacteria bacterium]|nr:hypothetical protein [Acidobacteriota bacterium]
MRTLRDVHLYLGCIFTPLLIFYAVTGTWQCFNFHLSMKDGSYTAPALIQEMSRVHMDAKAMIPTAPRMPGYFKYYALAMSAGLVTTSILGIILAFQVARRKWLIWACLGVGIVFPWWLVYG